MFFCIGFYFFITDSKTNNSTQKLNEIIIENKLENNTNPSITTKIDSIKTEMVSQKKVTEKVISNRIISTKKDKNTIQNRISKEDKKAIVAMKKDSVKAEKPKVIVIKKQIIKRDTIYVTK